MTLERRGETPVVTWRDSVTRVLSRRPDTNKVLTLFYSNLVPGPLWPRPDGRRTTQVTTKRRHIDVRTTTSSHREHTSVSSFSGLCLVPQGPDVRDGYTKAKWVYNFVRRTTSRFKHLTRFPQALLPFPMVLSSTVKTERKDQILVPCCRLSSRTGVYCLARDDEGWLPEALLRGGRIETKKSSLWRE